MEIEKKGKNKETQFMKFINLLKDYMTIGRIRTCSIKLCNADQTHFFKSISVVSASLKDSNYQRQQHVFILYKSFTF